MSAAEDIVRVGEPAPGPRTEEIKAEQPDTPKVGRWYYVKSAPRDDDKPVGAPRLACVTELGSNYIEVTFIGSDSRSRSYTRIHEDKFWERCEFVEDPKTLLRGNAERCRRELDGLMEDVKQLTSKLGVASNLALGAGEAQSTSLALASGAPAGEYKTALVKAKEETLPALFEAIKNKSAEFAMWLSADVIPMKAEAEALKPAIDRIESRIFAVELYAGLCEEVEQVKDGEPAALTEPVHLFQRRLYMDEECLANYTTGGMEFKNLREFDRWLCKKENLERVLPFPRTIVAFQVRRHAKTREIVGFRDFVKMLEEKDLDKLTFLYIRNGGRVFRLNTEIDFGPKLFPGVDHPVLTAGEGHLYGRESFNEWKFIGEAEYEAKIAAEEAAEAEYERREAEEAKKPKGDREHIFSPHHSEPSSSYRVFTRESVYYDDMAKAIHTEMEKHNRVVLVLQGLLDRSPALHPHPQWKLFDAGGFSQALVLHRDSDRVLVAGDKPDFEAYRTRVNASLAVGSVTVGQEEAWERFEGKRESLRRDRDHRWSRVEYRPERYRPEGDPGPGRFARVARLDRQGHAHYRWEKPRRGDGPPVARKYGCKTSRVLNVDAYTPGDYKQFFNDPRTRQEYLQWAPLLLAAEEYKAGHHGKVPLLKAPPKPAKAPAPTGAAGRLRMLRGYLGKAVRTTCVITTKGGKKYAKGLLWRVTALSAGLFTISGLTEDGETEPRCVRGVGHYELAVESSVAPDPDYGFKRAKHKRLGNVDDEDESAGEES